MLILLSFSLNTCVLKRAKPLSLMFQFLDVPEILRPRAGACVKLTFFYLRHTCTVSVAQSSQWPAVAFSTSILSLGHKR